MIYNDSDAPAHHLFVLLPPITAQSQQVLPDPLVVIQICLEGNISKKAALASLEKGTRSASGDMIPWVMSQQFQDDDFASLNGARIVRIAAHPDYIGMGYGARAVELLEQYYKGKFFDLNEDGEEKESVLESVSRVGDAELEEATLQSDEIKVRDAATMPALLLKLSERPLKQSEHLNWIGVSFGLTQPLQKFWKRAGFVPLYIRQTQNDITGEHTCMMLKALTADNSSLAVSTRPEWLTDFAWDFRRRLLELLAYRFKSFSPIVVLSILEAVGACRGSNTDLSNGRGLDSGLNIHLKPHCF